MSVPELLTAEELARTLGTSVQAIRSALYRGQEGKSIPPSIRLGTRRRWLRSTVRAWLHAKARSQQTTFRAALDGAAHTRKENQAMSRTRVFVGDVFQDDEGTTLTVTEVDAGEDRVVLEDESTNEGVMSLAEMLDALQAGELQRIESADDE